MRACVRVRCCCCCFAKSEEVSSFYVLAQTPSRQNDLGTVTMKSSNFFCRSDQAMQYIFVSSSYASVASGNNIFHRSKTLVRTGLQRNRDRERERMQTDRYTQREDTDRQIQRQREKDRDCVSVCLRLCVHVCVCV